MCVQSSGECEDEGLMDGLTCGWMDEKRWTDGAGGREGRNPDERRIATIQILLVYVLGATSAGQRDGQGQEESSDAAGYRVGNVERTTDGGRVHEE